MPRRSERRALRRELRRAVVDERRRLDAQAELAVLSLVLGRAHVRDVLRCGEGSGAETVLVLYGGRRVALAAAPLLDLYRIRQSLRYGGLRLAGVVNRRRGLLVLLQGQSGAVAVGCRSLRVR